MRGSSVTRPEPSARDPQIATEGGKAGNGAGTLPAVGSLVHRAAANQDHGRSHRGIAAGKGDDPLWSDPGDAGGPRWRMRREMRRKLIEADRVAGDEFPVVELLCDNHLHHR